MNDIVIVGLGPAAYTAALYCSRYKMSVKLIGAQPGGQVAASGEIDNYPGYVHTTGTELGAKMMEQVQKNGAEIVFDTVDSIEKKDDHFELTCSISGKQEGKIILLATGTKHRKLGVPGEEEFYGKGVTYCATCDGMFYKDKVVAIVGAGDSATEAALYLSDICPKVYVFVRKPHFRAQPILVEQVMAKKNIVVEFETELAEIRGEEKVSSVLLKSGEIRELEGIFMEIGADPLTELASGLGVELDKQKFIKVDTGQRTNIPRVLAAGDATTASEKFAQIATAVGEGAVASKAAYEIYQKEL